MCAKPELSGSVGGQGGAGFQRAEVRDGPRFSNRQYTPSGLRSPLQAWEGFLEVLTLRIGGRKSGEGMWPRGTPGVKPVSSAEEEREMRNDLAQSRPILAFKLHGHC